MQHGTTQELPLRTNIYTPVLLQIVVKDAANTMYKFEVNRWLAKDKDDGQIERELSLSKSLLWKQYDDLKFKKMFSV